MANLSSDDEIGSEHACDLLPSKGGTCARCGEFIAPIPGAMSTHDEQTLALIRNGRSVSAVKFQSTTGLFALRTAYIASHEACATVLRMTDMASPTVDA